MSLSGASTPDIRFATNNYNGLAIPVSKTNGTIAPPSGLHNSQLSLPPSDSLASVADIDSLRNEVLSLKRELTKCKEIINKMQDREKTLKDR